MTGFFMFLHAFISILLIVIILMQSGRGGGLTESFASAESMFGAKTNEFMIKSTTVFASLFLATCLGLAVLSSQKGKSLMSSAEVSQTQVPAAQTAGAEVQPPEAEVSTEAPAENIPEATEEVVSEIPLEAQSK